MLVYQTLVYIKNLYPELQSDTIMTDFELATLNAAESVFPRATRSGCLFHFGQSAYWNIRNLGCKVRYDEDAVFQHQINKLNALGFIPYRYRNTGICRNEMEDRLPDTVLNYFEEMKLNAIEDMKTTTRKFSDW